MAYRKYLIIGINLIVSIWLVKTIFYAKYDTDFFGLFLSWALGFCMVYNMYVILVCKCFFSNAQKRIFIEIFFILLILLPFFILWLLT
jgi:hypothetical protein